MDQKHKTDVLKNEDAMIIGDQPGKLPQGMANHLDPDLKTWLKETYASAYISLQIANFSTSQVKDWVEEAKLTDADIKRIRYWWGGKGKNCLA
ncbi:hypothetical protein N7493_001180 [Penicillium malachiteum]|uniref:Uncharacterized protein n=1 Tax=Penicillium malachiteum TaxID=1324776 RepID=A0AAD6HTQ8_9EURO|nr:hypothetical protein N7493_001180 [Penicillium malachiteum]